MHCLSAPNPTLSTCSVLIELDPANISPLSSGIMLSCVLEALTATAGERLLFLALVWSLGRFLQHLVPVPAATWKHTAHLPGQLPPTPQRLIFQCVAPVGSFPATSTVWRLSMEGFPQHPGGMLSSGFHLHGTSMDFLIQWAMVAPAPTRYGSRPGERRWRSGPQIGLFLPWMLCHRLSRSALTIYF